jgi:L,D-transpeptidase YcbB
MLMRHLVRYAFALSVLYAVAPPVPAHALESSPAVQMPEAQTPEIQIPEIQTPDVEKPEIRIARDVAIASRLAKDGPLTIDGQRLRNLEALRRFYARRGFAPVWQRDDRPAATVGELVALLQAADAEGLEPFHYHPDSIAGRLTASDPQVQAELDLLVTDAVMEYAVDLRTGRLPPRSVDADLAMMPPDLDRLAIAETAAGASDIHVYLAGFVPPHPEYAALRRELAEYRRIAVAGWPLAGDGSVLKPGMQDPSVPRLRKRLAATGEFKGADLKSETFDAPLEAAVKRFQSRHGMTPDGVVGTATRAAMNVSAPERVGQIIANMERWRWLPDQLGDRFVMVNVPGYSLKAVDHGQIALRMPVIVGQTERPTPVLNNQISHLVFNPTWTIPGTIAKKDILPKVIRDPGFLTSQNIRVFDGKGAGARSINPNSIDWHSVGSSITRFRLIQAPGPQNALGQVKFMFPNDFDIYLHDTPSRDKFRRTVRMLSSGCVRVGDPAALTEFLLAGMPEWPAERRQQVIDKGETRTVWLREPVAVYLTYQTVLVDESGQIQFRADIYDRDADYLAALAKRLPTQEKVAAIGG